MEEFRKSNEIYNNGEYDCQKVFDENNNEIYRKYSNGFEMWREYDEYRNCTHYKDSNGREFWKEFDKNGNVVTEGSQVMLGGNDSYIAMCHRCYKKKIGM